MYIYKILFLSFILAMSVFYFVSTLAYTLSCCLLSHPLSVTLFSDLYLSGDSNFWIKINTFHLWYFLLLTTRNKLQLMELWLIGLHSRLLMFSLQSLNMVWFGDSKGGGGWNVYSIKCTSTCWQLINIKFKKKKGKVCKSKNENPIILNTRIWIIVSFHTNDVGRKWKFT